MAKTGFAVSAAPAYCQNIIDMLEATLITHTNWSKVTTVNSPGGMPCSVWKCAGAGNSHGADFYLYIARVVVNPQVIYFACSEGFNITTSKVIRPAPGTGQGMAAPAADFSYGGGAEYSIWAATGSTLNEVDIRWHPFHNTWLTQAYATVSKDWCSLIGFISQNDARHMWLGSVPSLNNPADKAIIQSVDVGPAVAAMTRHYNQTARHPNNFRVGSPGYPWTPVSGEVNGAGDRLYGNLPVGARCVAIVENPADGIQPNDYRAGRIWGLYPDMYKFGTAASMFYGDTVTVAGKKYLYAGTHMGMPNVDAP